MHAVLQRPEVIKRRVETIDVVDEWHFNRRVSLMVDTRLLRSLARRSRFWGESGTLPLPISSPYKEVLLEIDTSLDGQALPVLVSDENAHAAYCMLLEILRTASPRFGHLPAEVLSEIYGIVRNNDTVVDLLHRIQSAGNGSLIWEQILENDEFFDALLDLSQKYLLMVHVPVDQNDLVLKYRRLDGRDTKTRWFRARRLGFAPFKLDIPVAGIGTSAREHTRIMLPSGTSTEWAWLERDGEPVDPESYVIVRELDRVVIYTRGFPAGGYSTVVTLRPRRSDLVVPATAATLMTAMFLWAGWWLEDENRRFSSGSASADAAVAVIALLLSAVSLYLLQRSEHQLLSKFYFVPRVAIVLSVGATLTTAAAMAADVSHDSLSFLLMMSAIVVSATSSYLAMFWVAISMSRTRLSERFNDWRVRRRFRKATMQER